MSAGRGGCMSAAALVTSLLLPFSAFWTNVTPAGGKLLVWGYANPGRGCVFVRVDPATLQSAHSRGSCAGTRRLTPDSRPSGRSTWQQVRVAGRLAFTYDDGSD